MPARSLAAARPEDAQARHLPRQQLERVRGEGLLVSGHPLHADALEVAHRSAEADGRSDIGRAGLELVGDLVERRVPQVHGADHLATREEGRHRLEQLAAGPEGARARGPQDLVPGEHVEVRADGPHVDRQVRHGLRPVDEDEGACGVGLVDHAADRRERPQGVGLVGEGDQLGSRAQQDLPGLEVQEAVPIEGHELEVGVLLLREELPGHQVGVMLELRQDDGVSPPDVATSPGVGDEVDGLGGVADEDDLGRVRSADEVRHGLACTFVGRRGLLTDGVDAAMDVGAVAPLVGVHRLDDGAWLEGRGGAVEVREAAAGPELPLEDGEVATDDVSVEESGSVHHRRHGCQRRRRPPSALLDLEVLEVLDLGILVELIDCVAGFAEDGRIALVLETQGQVLAA